MASVKRNSANVAATLNLAAYGFSADGVEDRDVGLITELGSVERPETFTLTFDDLQIPDPIVEMETLAKRFEVGRKRKDLTVQQRSRVVKRYNEAAIAYAEAMAALYSAEMDRTLAMLAKQDKLADWTFSGEVAERRQLSRKGEYRSVMPCASYYLHIVPPVDNETLDAQIDEILASDPPAEPTITRKPDGSTHVNGIDHSA